MNLLLESDLEPLLEERPGPCLSFYLPVFGSGTRAQGPLRLKNLLSRAEADLRAQGFDTMAVEVLLGPLEDLLADLSFWNTREEGIALFRAPGFTRAFYLSHGVAERHAVGNHFFLKPLLPLLGSDEAFYVLALSQNETRLLEPTFQEARRRAAERFRELIGTGRASNDPSEILPAAHDGRVETLFLTCDADLWGRLENPPGPGRVRVHPAPEESDEELLDTAALFSLRHGGAVYGMDHGEVPGGGDLAAVFRY